MARLGDDSDSGTESSLEEEVVQSESDDEEEVVVSDDSEEEIEIEEGDADGEEEIVEPLGESYEEVIDIGDDMEDEIILEEPVTQDSGFYVDEILEDDEPAVQEDESRRGAAEEARDEPVFESYTTRTPPPPQEDARKVAAVAPVAIAASPTLSNSATGPVAKGDDDEEVHRPPGELPRIDILLIVLIVIAAIIVVTILCVLYANPGTGPATPIPPKPTVAPSLAPQVVSFVRSICLVGYSQKNSLNVFSQEHGPDLCRISAGGHLYRSNGFSVGCRHSCRRVGSSSRCSWYSQCDRVH